MIIILLPIYNPDSPNKDKYPLTQKIEEFVRLIFDLRKQGKTTAAKFLEKQMDEMVDACCMDYKKAIKNDCF